MPGCCLTSCVSGSGSPSSNAGGEEPPVGSLGGPLAESQPLIGGNQNSDYRYPDAVVEMVRSNFVRHPAAVTPQQMQKLLEMLNRLGLIAWMGGRVDLEHTFALLLAASDRASCADSMRASSAVAVRTAEAAVVGGLVLLPGWGALASPLSSVFLDPMANRAAHAVGPRYTYEDVDNPQDERASRDQLGAAGVSGVIRNVMSMCGYDVIASALAGVGGGTATQIVAGAALAQLRSQVPLLDAQDIEGTEENIVRLRMSWCQSACQGLQDMMEGVWSGARRALTINSLREGLQVATGTLGGVLEVVLSNIPPITQAANAVGAVTGGASTATASTVTLGGGVLEVALSNTPPITQAANTVGAVTGGASTVTSMAATTTAATIIPDSNARRLMHLGVMALEVAPFALSLLPEMPTPCPQSGEQSELQEVSIPFQATGQSDNGQSSSAP